MIIAIMASKTMAYIVFDDLRKPDMPGFSKWCYLNMSADHTNRQPNQPPWQWTNITFNLSGDTKAVQFTAVYQNTSKPMWNQEVPYYEVDEILGILRISVTWWYKPWILYVGWYYYPPTHMPGKMPLPQCKPANITVIS